MVHKRAKGMCKHGAECKYGSTCTKEHAEGTVFTNLKPKFEGNVPSDSTPGTPGLEKYAAKIASEGLELRELDPDHREEMGELFRILEVEGLGDKTRIKKHIRDLKAQPAILSPTPTKTTAAPQTPSTKVPPSTPSTAKTTPQTPTTTTTTAKTAPKTPATTPKVGASGWAELDPAQVQKNLELRRRYKEDPKSLTTEEKERAAALVERDERKKDKKELRKRKLESPANPTPTQRSAAAKLAAGETTPAPTTPVAKKPKNGTGVIIKPGIAWECPRCSEANPGTIDECSKCQCWSTARKAKHIADRDSNNTPKPKMGQKPVVQPTSATSKSPAAPKTSEKGKKAAVAKVETKDEGKSEEERKDLKRERKLEREKKEKEKKRAKEGVTEAKAAPTSEKKAKKETKEPVKKEVKAETKVVAAKQVVAKKEEVQSVSKAATGGDDNAGGGKLCHIGSSTGPSDEPEKKKYFCGNASCPDCRKQTCFEGYKSWRAHTNKAKKAQRKLSNK